MYIKAWYMFQMYLILINGVVHCIRAVGHTSTQKAPPGYRDRGNWRTTKTINIHRVVNSFWGIKMFTSSWFNTGLREQGIHYRHTRIRHPSISFLKSCGNKPLKCYTIKFQCSPKLCTATATHNFKWVEITCQGCVTLWARSADDLVLIMSKRSIFDID